MRKTLPDRIVTPKDCPLLQKPVTLQVWLEDGVYEYQNDELTIIMLLEDRSKFYKEFLLNIEVLIAVYYQADPAILSDQCIELQQTLGTYLTKKAKAPDYKFEVF